MLKTPEEGSYLNPQELISKWRALRAEYHSPDANALDQLTANFMIGRSSRISDREKDDPLYGNVQPNKINHLYIMGIAIRLLEARDPHLTEILKIVELISDFDLIEKSSELGKTKPYTGEFEGVFKFRHPDFRPLAQAFKEYFYFVEQNEVFKSQIGEKIKLREDSENMTYYKPQPSSEVNSLIQFVVGVLLAHH